MSAKINGGATISATFAKLKADFLVALVLSTLYAISCPDLCPDLLVLPSECHSESMTGPTLSFKFRQQLGVGSAATVATLCSAISSLATLKDPHYC
jgi:hypothetical protein